MKLKTTLVLLTAVILTAIGCVVAAACLKPPIETPDFVYLGLVIMGVWLVWIGAIRAVTILLIASLIGGYLPAAEPEPLPLVVVGGLIVIGVGGCAIIRKAQKCGDKIAKARSNALEQVEFVPAGGLSYAAYFSWGESGYCVEERLLGPPTTFTINLVVGQKPVISATQTWATVQSWDSFKAESAEIGIQVSDGLAPHESYSANLKPCFAKEVPVRFNHQTKTVTLGAGGVLVKVERSQDLRTWETLMRIEAEPGQELQISDATRGESGFYRVVTKEL